MSVKKIREINEQNMRAIFENGCKEEKSPLRFGVEVEHFVVRENGESISYFGGEGMEQVLEALSPYYKKRQESEGHLIGLYGGEKALSLEPASQLEVSISPQSDPDKIVEIYQAFYRETMAVLEPWGYHLEAMGYQPLARVDDLELIPKKRYEYMDRYFQTIGKYGRQMMRGTASAQVSIDYYNEEDFTRKYGIAYHLVPFLASLCEYTPVYEGQPCKEKGIRMKIWDNTDPLRVDTAPFMQEGSLDFNGYIRFVMQAPVIVNEISGKEEYSEKTIGELCQEQILSEEGLEHVLSMVFPMIRLKNYMEIRIADSMPIDAVKAYVLLIKGIFLDVELFEAYLRKLREKGITIEEDRAGFIETVKQNLSEEEKDYLKPYAEKIVQEGTILL